MNWWKDRNIKSLKNIRLCRTFVLSGRPVNVVRPSYSFDFIYCDIQLPANGRALPTICWSTWSTPRPSQRPKAPPTLLKKAKICNWFFNLVFWDAFKAEIHWSYVWHEAAKGGSHHLSLSHLSTIDRNQPKKRFVDDNTITSMMGRKSSIILDLGDSTICNSLISAEKVLHGRGQFEGSTPKNNLSKCTEKKVVVYIFQWEIIFT